MQREHFIRNPERPGLEVAYSIIPEDMNMVPKCPCKTRTCPHHGFCEMCARHHADLNERAALDGRKAHGTMCDRLREARLEAQKEGGEGK